MLATAAYNGGKGNVSKWIAQFGDPRKGDISDYEFAQNIPFDQTNEYVARVVYGETRAGRGRSEANAIAPPLAPAPAKAVAA